VKTRSSQRIPGSNRSTAFSLLEVMIACGIFFIAVFAILALVSNTLRNAQRLRRVEVQAGMVAALIVRTNTVPLGSQTIDLADFGYQDYSADIDVEPDEVFTNGMLQIGIVLRKRGMPEPLDVRTVFLY